MDFPEEILSLIYSFIPTDFRDGHSPSLRGLQIAYASRGLYRRFQPHVIKCYIALLKEARRTGVIQVNGNLMLETIFWRFEDQQCGALSLQGHLSGTIQTSTHDQTSKPDVHSIHFSSGRRDERDVLWSLNSLFYRATMLQLSIPFFLFLGGSRDSLQHPGYSRDRDALMKLFERVMEHDSIALAISQSETLCVDSSTIYPLVPRQVWAPTTDFRPRLSTIVLNGPLDFPFTRIDIDTMIIATAVTLTTLEFLHVELTQTQWDEILGSWTLPRLETLKITAVDGVEIPFTALSSFLNRHQLLTHAILIVSTTTPAPCLQNSDASGRPLDTLHRLCSTPQTLIHLIQSSNIAITQLREVTVDTTTPHFKWVEDDTLDSALSDVTSVLDHLGDGAPHLERLIIKLPSIPGVQKWLAGAKISNKSQRLLNLANRFGLKAQVADSATEGLATQNVGRRAQSLGMAIRSLNQVQRVHLSFHAKSPDDYATLPNHGLVYIHPRSIVGFLASFPSLKEAYIHNAFLYTLDSARGHYDGSLWKRLEKIWSECKTLQKLDIRGIGTVERLMSWNREDKGPMQDQMFGHTLSPLPS